MTIANAAITEKEPGIMLRPSTGLEPMGHGLFVNRAMLSQLSYESHMREVVSGLAFMFSRRNARLKDVNPVLSLKFFHVIFSSSNTVMAAFTSIIIFIFNRYCWTSVTENRVEKTTLDGV